MVIFVRMCFVNFVCVIFSFFKIFFCFEWRLISVFSLCIKMIFFIFDFFDGLMFIEYDGFWLIGIVCLNILVRGLCLEGFCFF